MLLEPGLQRDGIVVVLVAGGIEQGDRALAQPVSQLARRRLGRRALQLRLIGDDELLPVRRPGMEAPAQRVARRDVLEPEIDPRLVAGDAARPQPVDEDPRPVLRRRGVPSSSRCWTR